MNKLASPKTICIVRLSAIGDTCHALAVVRAIQDAIPEAKITWIIGATEASLLADIPDIEFIIFNKRKGREGRANLNRALKDRRFDVALCMHASMRANLINRSIQSPLRIGFDFARARDFQWLFTNQKIAAKPQQHVLDGMMGFAEHIGVTTTDLRWDIPLSTEDQAFAAETTGKNSPICLISPCSSQRSRNFRNWSVENYATIAKYARDVHGCKIIVTGGPTALENSYGKEINDMVGSGTTNVVGKTTLKQLLALIAKADIVVCPDSGPAHMATAVGTPVLGLYATSNPDRSGPYLHRELTVNRYPDAVGRYLGKRSSQLRWGQRVRNPDAMDLITVLDVKEKFDFFFENKEI